MKFTLLGSGTSTGVPLAGCQCAVCKSPNPKNFRNRTSATITLDCGAVVLIDAGPDLRHQCIRHRVHRVDAVIYTHGHADHILGTDDLRSFNFIGQKRIACYGTKETLASLTRSFAYIFDPAEHYMGGMLAQLDLHEFSNSDVITVEGKHFQTFSLPHGNVSVTGLRVGDLAYLTDFKGLPPQTACHLQGLKHLFIDGLRFEPHNTHNTIDEAIAISQELRAERTYLIHTTHTIDYDTVNPALPPGIELGYDGLTIDLS